MLAYLDAYLPTWAQPLVEKIGENVEPYFRDFGDEIIGLASMSFSVCRTLGVITDPTLWHIVYLGLAKALGAPMGDLVALNLVYQIEHVGLNW